MVVVLGEAGRGEGSSSGEGMAHSQAHAGSQRQKAPRRRSLRNGVTVQRAA